MEEISKNILSWSVISAVIGFLFKSIYELIMQNRKENLEYINKQIEKLYGPVYILDKINYTSYQAFSKKIDKENDFDLENTLSEQELKEWILWVKEIFMPTNLKVEEAIINNSHLIIEEKVPQCVLDFTSHVTVYKTVLEKWKKDDYNEIFSIIDYPVELSEYIEKSYHYLKKRQKFYMKLLKI